MGLKPIFEQERCFFKEKSGIELPTDCWRNGTKIYLDIYCNKPLYTFKVIDKKIKIIKNNEKLFKDYRQVKLDEIKIRERERVNNLYKQSYEFLLNYLYDHKNISIVFNHSGGKDSCLSYDIFKKVLKEIPDLDYVISFANTSNDTADTYKFIMNNDNIEQSKLKIMNPKEGFYQMIKRTNYFVPTALSRKCCSVYKEGQIQKNYDTNKEYIMILGVRKYESTKRAKYNWVMDYEFYTKLFGDKNNSPKKWINIAPIIEWKDEDVWIYCLDNNISLNPQYKMGYNRCGCLICPYQSDYIDLLTEVNYPTLWKRWTQDILPKSYEKQLIGERFKWTLNEFINGKWKSGTSKIYEITRKSPTKERLKEVCDIMGIDSEELAKQYFSKKCCKCNKQLNPSEVGMNLKLFGRQLDIDNKGLCKKCMCKELGLTSKEYAIKVREFREGGCNLF